MRALTRTIVAAFALVAASGCTDSVTATEATEVRFRNETTFALTDVFLAWPGGSAQVAALAPGATSAYERHDGAYSYGALQVTGGGKVRRLHPIDYMGEEPLSAGRYTYVIMPSTYFADGIDLRLEIAN